MSLHGTHLFFSSTTTRHEVTQPLRRNRWIAAPTPVGRPPSSSFSLTRPPTACTIRRTTTPCVWNLNPLSSAGPFASDFGPQIGWAAAVGNSLVSSLCHGKRTNGDSEGENPLGGIAALWESESWKKCVNERYHSEFRCTLTIMLIANLHSYNFCTIDSWY